MTKKTAKPKSKKAPKCNVGKLCPTERLVSLLTGPWTTYILWLISSKGGLQRFSELKNAMPKISAKVLTERLRMLEAEGILTRHQEETIPPKVTYSLTRRGKELNCLLGEINRLAKKWYSNK